MESYSHNLIQWLKDLQERIYKGKQYEYSSIKQIAEWTNINYKEFQKIFNMRTCVFIDNKQTGETEEDYMVSENIGGIVASVRFMATSDFELTIDYDDSINCDEIEGLMSDIFGFILEFINNNH